MLTSWLPPLLWCAVIYAFSGDTSSMEHSSKVFGPLIRWLFPHFTEAQVASAVFILRKVAHVTVYAILAILVWRAVEKPSWRNLGPWRWSAVGLTLCLVLGYATADEIHQTFVPTRQGSPVDILIDLSGALLGLSLVWVTQKIISSCTAPR